jgi:hypothetical protein
VSSIESEHLTAYTKRTRTNKAILILIYLSTRLQETMLGRLKSARSFKKRMSSKKLDEIDTAELTDDSYEENEERMHVWKVHSDYSGESSNEDDQLSVEIPAGHQKMDRFRSSSSFLHDGKDGAARLVKTKGTSEAPIKLERGRSLRRRSRSSFEYENDKPPKVAQETPSEELSPVSDKVEAAVHSGSCSFHQHQDGLVQLLKTQNTLESSRRSVPLRRKWNDSLRSTKRRLSSYLRAKDQEIVVIEDVSTFEMEQELLREVQPTTTKEGARTASVSVN